MSLSFISAGLQLQGRQTRENNVTGLQLSCQAALLPSMTVFPNFSYSSVMWSFQISHMEEFFSIGCQGQPASGSS